jgi:hypothetical protein
MWVVRFLLLVITWFRRSPPLPQQSEPVAVPAIDVELTLACSAVAAAAHHEPLNAPVTRTRPAVNFMRMMMAHAKFEREVRTLQSSVTKDPNFGEQRNNQWPARERPNRMAKLIEEKLGQIPETKAIVKLLKDARVPNDKRNELVHGTWWRFNPRTATITVRAGSQQKNKNQFAEYTEERILEIADAFKAFSAELYKLRRDIENRRGDHDGDELSFAADPQ